MASALKELRRKRQKSTITEVLELYDFNGTLGELQAIVEKLVKENGKHQVIVFDAGYNTVTATIERKG